MAINSDDDYAFSTATEASPDEEYNVEDDLEYGEFDVFFIR
jgi:hypothetical protein